jgi:hypothetical protein
MSLFKLITKIITEIESNGYDSDLQLKLWMDALKAQAVESMLPESIMRELLQKSMETIYGRITNGNQVLKHHKGIGKFTLDMVRPQLRHELDHRIMASASLIKLNRDEAVQKTLRRFAGWATSIPAGGEVVEGKIDIKLGVVKALKQLPFVERRVLIDQGHKLTSSLNNIIATGGGAIAVVWHSHWKQMNYNYREDHKDRDQHTYLLRNTWATQNGLVKPDSVGYYEDITAFGHEVNCRCYGEYLYNLRDLPLELITKKGHESLMQASRVL